MARISVGEAISAGFRLIGREPVAFAVWCGLYLLINLLPMLAVWPATLEMYGALAAGAQPDEARMLEASSQVAALQPLTFVILLLVLAVLPSAVFRAILNPEDRRFFYLRLGMRELWVVVVSIVVFLIWFLAFIGAFIPIGMLMFGAGLAAGGNEGGAVAALLVVVLGYIAAIGITLWVVLRFSMAPVMSFAQNTFRVPESWRLTKGHAWRLFLVALALFAITILGQILLLGAGFAALVAGTPDFMQTLQANPAAILANIGLPAMIAGSVIFSIFGVAAYVLGAAAWADMYRQLKPPLAETFA